MTVRKSSADWWARGIAFSGFVASLIALWSNTLSGPDLTVLISTPSFQWSGTPAGAPQPGTAFGMPVIGTNHVLRVKATLTFANNGARIGTIDHLVLLFVDSDTGTRWLATADWLVDDMKTYTDVSQQGWLRQPFQPIVVPGRQTIAHSYMFIVEPVSESSKDSVGLTPHNFTVTVRTLSPTESKPQDREVLHLVLDPMKLAAINSGYLQAIPFEEDYPASHLLSK